MARSIYLILQKALNNLLTGSYINNIYKELINKSRSNIIKKTIIRTKMDSGNEYFSEQICRRFYFTDVLTTNKSLIFYLTFYVFLLVELSYRVIFVDIPFSKNMISNMSQKRQPCELYKPPHLRKERVQTKLDNDTSKSMDDYLEINVKKKESLPRWQTQCGQIKSNLSNYYDCQFQGSYMEYNKKLEESTTLYVGRLNVNSSETSIRKLFSKAGNIKSIIMGVKKKTLAPAGFCFIEYETRVEAENCMATMKEAVLDKKKLFIDWDAGFVEGRQYERVDRTQRPKFKNRYFQSKLSQ